MSPAVHIIMYNYYYKNRTRSTQLKKASKHYNAMQRKYKKKKEKKYSTDNTQFKNN